MRDNAPPPRTLSQIYLIIVCSRLELLAALSPPPPPPPRSWVMTAMNKKLLDQDINLPNCCVYSLHIILIWKMAPAFRRPDPPSSLPHDWMLTAVKNMLMKMLYLTRSWGIAIIEFFSGDRVCRRPAVTGLPAPVPLVSTRPQLPARSAFARCIYTGRGRATAWIGNRDPGPGAGGDAPLPRNASHTRFRNFFPLRVLGILGTLTLYTSNAFEFLC